MPAEVTREAGVLFQNRVLDFRLVVKWIQARFMWLDAIQQAQPAGRTSWSDAMRVGEVNAAFGQSIHVGRFSLGVATQKSDPIVHVVNRDEQDVRLGRCLRFFCLSAAGGRQRQERRSQNNENAIGVFQDQLQREKVWLLPL